MAPNTGSYYLLFGALSLACVVAVKASGMASDVFKSVTTSPEFTKFQRGFLAVYFLMVAGDWLQGPYVYKLYSHYGFTSGEIGFLFVAGFLASAVFGTFIASLADRLGRKKMCIVYGLMYSASCLTKHMNNWHVLFLGRILGGTATSILFSAFESWMVHEHKRAGYPDEWLSKTFSMVMFGNGVVAIVCGIVAGFGVDAFGYVAPFDMSMVCLLLGTAVVWKMWTENYGDESGVFGANFVTGWVTMSSQPKIWLLGLAQSSFEGAMYIFVFSWTPTLEEADPHLPHGLIFAAFMVSCMIGSSFFKTLSSRDATPGDILVKAFGVSFCALAMPALTENIWFRLISFFVFECCVGLYFPSMGMLRGKVIPDEVRSTIMNFFRIPLNMIVVLVLVNVGDMSVRMIAASCSALLACATVLQLAINRLDKKNYQTVAGEEDKDLESASA